MYGGADNLGIIPRSIPKMFDFMKTASITGWNFEVTATFLEIHNEVFIDLLNKSSKNIEIKMKNEKSHEIFLTNVEERTVETENQLQDLMNAAMKNRATASTKGNNVSSRSHAVTRIQIAGENSWRQQKLVGSISFVDLAGSESATTSTRMGENSSLSELKNVFLALKKKQAHVPFRNSKLTHLLRSSLEGNSKVLMFVNDSSLQTNFVESLKSLRFANDVASCKLEKAKRNKVQD